MQLTRIESPIKREWPDILLLEVKREVEIPKETTRPHRNLFYLLFLIPKTFDFSSRAFVIQFLVNIVLIVLNIVFCFGWPKSNLHTVSLF